MKLREATAEDAGLISSIIAQSWRGTYQHFIDPIYLARLPEEYWLPSMRTWLSSGRMYVQIAEADERALGCIIYGRGREEDHADWGEIVSLYLLPDAMGRGIGSELLTSAVYDLQADGYHRIYLWAIEENTRALRFYSRHGFVRTGERVNYRIGGGDVTDIRLALEG